MRMPKARPAAIARFHTRLSEKAPSGVSSKSRGWATDTPVNAKMRLPRSSVNFLRQFIPGVEELDGDAALDVDVRGTIARDELKIMRAIGRHPTERKRMSVHSRAPREALSHVRVLYRLTSLPIRTTVVIVRPETGRTHQIRVHLSSIGHPCLGDPLYGGATGKDEPFFSSRQALHALALRLDHPRTGERLEYIAPLPDDLIAFFEKAKLGEAAVRKLAIAD